MSDFAGSIHSTHGAAAIAGTPSPVAQRAATVHESYSFACMRCGHGWEQTYEIERHADQEGHPYVVYLAEGERVPSPLSSPSCLNCGGTVVRIMRAGRVTSATSQPHTYGPGAGSERRVRPERLRAGTRTGGGADGAGAGTGEAAGEVTAPHHWHVLADLLHVFHRRPARGR
jgi:hypothetical protein